MFGYKKALPVEERPIYGYLRDPNAVDGASWYGDVLMDFKPAVRERTTVVWTDSLGSVEQPSPLTRIRASSYNPRSDLRPGHRQVGCGRMPRSGRTGTALHRGPDARRALRRRHPPGELGRRLEPAALIVLLEDPRLRPDPRHDGVDPPT